MKIARGSAHAGLPGSGLSALLCLLMCFLLCLLPGCAGDDLPAGRGQIIPNPARSYQPVSGSPFPATPSPAPPFAATPRPQSPFPNTAPFPATPRPASPFPVAPARPRADGHPPESSLGG